MQSLATLDAILSPEWEFRYYSFDAYWGENEQMASIRSGSGDTVFMLFNSAGCFLKGFSPGYPGNGKQSYDFYSGVPDEFREASTEPAFSPENVSYCSWRKATDSEWYCSVPVSSLNENSFSLLQGLDGNERTYQKYALGYYEMSLNLDDISSIFQHEPMRLKLAKSLNPQIDYSNLMRELIKIGYHVKKRNFLKFFSNRE